MGKLKIALLVISLLLIAIALSIAINIFLLKYRVVNISKIFIDGEKVVVSQEAQSTLDSIYTDDLCLEVPVCLGGEIGAEELRITDVSIPEITEQSESGVTFIQCPVYIGLSQTIGTLHNHPNNSCMLSPKDIETYLHGMNRGQSIIGLKCGEGYIYYVLSRFESEVESD